MPTTGAQICDHFHVEPAEFVAMSLPERALYRAAYAADVLKVVEVPRGSNCGPDVERYLRSVGVEPGEPWCAAFVSCMLLDSGAARASLPEEAASVHGWLDWATRNGFVRTSPARGYAGLIIEGPTTGHMVLVNGLLLSGVRTIEGNTNDDGSRDGYGVFRRSRVDSQFHCFVDLSGITS